MASKKKMSVSQVYGKLLKRRDALQKDIDNSGDPLVVKPAMDSLAELDNKINQLRDLQQSKNGNNGEDTMKYGGKMPMYFDGGETAETDEIPMGMGYDMYGYQDPTEGSMVYTDEYKHLDPFANKVKKTTTGSGYGSTTREEPPSPMPMRTTNQKYMSPGQAPIVNRDASYYGMDSEWTTPKSRERNIGETAKGIGNTAAQLAPIAYNVYSALKEGDEFKTFEDPYKASAMRALEYKPISYNPQLDAITRQAEATRRSIPGMAGGSSTIGMNALLRSGMGYSGKMADAIRSTQAANQAAKQRAGLAQAQALGRYGQQEIAQKQQKQQFDLGTEARKSDVLAQAARDVSEYQQRQNIDLNTAEQNAMQMEILRRSYPDVYAEIMNPNRV
jgi:hypothetical protein